MKTTKNLKNLPSVLTASEYAEVVGLSVSTVRRWCQKGQLPAVRTGGIWLISRDHAFKELL